MTYPQKEYRQIETNDVRYVNGKEKKPAREQKLDSIRR